MKTGIQTTKTPTLLLDEKRVRRNAKRISEKAKANNVRLRPHVKTHKCIEVAKIQTADKNGIIYEVDSVVKRSSSGTPM